MNIMTLSHDDYLNLVKKCNELNEEYYQNNQSSVTDQQYDLWYQKLKSYEAQHPLLIASNSPTKHVGSKPTTGFSQYKHKEPLLSLSNAFNEEDIEKFIERIAKETSRTPILN